MNTNNNTLLKAIVIAMSGSSLLSGGVFADEYHYRDILVGDRAAGLAGAYTAISDDPSGQYYNPAGIVYVSSPKLSGSANAYQLKTTTYKNISKANPDQTWTRKSSGMVANFFGMVQPLGKGTVGFSIAIPNYELEDQSDYYTNIEASQTFKTGVTFNKDAGATTATTTFKADSSKAVSISAMDFNNSDTTTLAGVSYALPVSKSLSIGATLYGYTRKKEMTLEQVNLIKGTFSDGSVGTIKDTFYQKVQTNELGVQPRLGVMWAPVPKVSIGLMAQTTLILSQSPETRLAQSTSSIYGETAYDATTGTYQPVSAAGFENANIALQTIAKNDLPVEINLGAALFATDALLYTADISYAAKTNRYEATLNAAAGVEYFLDQSWAVRGGLYTNNANTVADVANSGNPHVNLLGAALSASRYTKGSNITVGINFSAGSGQENLNVNTTNTQSISVSATSIFVSTSASF